MSSDELAVLPQDEAARPLIELMHGDCKASTRNLARALSCALARPVRSICTNCR